ncbi:hypothetical protein K7X08_018973 [Anisodus acutangulus]|uniref:Small ribosomal subunit protein mS38 n=2 Tax=Anisodus TaxID=243963 RepID=A0A9Q1R9N5_9SOLA|nr:hypothetical protein K7X08_018973 [Anisodus acutangulus]KAK4346241.1 hypothetical protein RND71_032580 [Anisodus tanguticus]
MALILRKALRNQFQSATTRIITNLNKSEPSILTSTPPPNLTHPSQIPFIPQRETKDSNLNFAYPSFSFGLFLNPISQIGLIKSENNDEGVIWADSVKKKRKKKMNKHKLKKLSKRLRRKTKT